MGSALAAPMEIAAPDTRAGALDRLVDHPSHMRRIDLADTNPLVAVRLPAHELDARHGDAEELADELAHCRVGTSLQRWRRHLHLEGIAMAAHHGRAAGAGLDVQAQEHVDGAARNRARLKLEQFSGHAGIF